MTKGSWSIATFHKCQRRVSVYAHKILRLVGRHWELFNLLRASAFEHSNQLCGTARCDRRYLVRAPNGHTLHCWWIRISVHFIEAMAYVVNDTVCSWRSMYFAPLDTTVHSWLLRYNNAPPHEAVGGACASVIPLSYNLFYRHFARGF